MFAAGATVAMAILATAIALATGGSPASTGPPYHYSTQQKAALQSQCEHALQGVAEEARQHAGAAEPEPSSLAIGEHATNECQCYLPSREAKAPPDKTVAAGDVLSDPGCVFDASTKTTTPGHTPEEEAAHNKSLETDRRGEEQGALAQKKVEEDENRGGEHSIRRVEEKVCYESGKTSEECKGPLKETPQEERSEAENKARQQQSQEESTGQPAVVE